jgi:hypothetical protein
MSNYGPPPNPYQPPAPPGAYGPPQGYGQPQGYGYGQQQGYGYGQPVDPSQMGELRIHTSFMFLQWILFLVSTSIQINQQLLTRPWGWTSLPLPAGTYRVRVAFNYLFGPQGDAFRQITVYPGHTTTLRYSAPFFMFMGGDLMEGPAQPTHMLPPAR